MKKAKSKNLLFALLLGTLAIMLILTSTIGNVSAYNAAPKKLIVKGSSEITFKPDSANVCVGVETVNSNVTTAQKENAETMEKVIETLINNGIERDSIKTTSYNIFKQHNYNTGAEFINTQVSNRISFNTNNIDDLSSLITKLTESGANVFGGITFELSDSSEAYNQALEKAIENAKAKAKVLAPNVTLEIKEILEEYSYCSPCYFDNFARAELNTNSIMKGDVKVCANVKVIFTCENVIETNSDLTAQNANEVKFNNTNKVNVKTKNKTTVNNNESVMDKEFLVNTETTNKVSNTAA